jgi:DNA-binding NarL/FixJ family response regulator
MKASAAKKPVKPSRILLVDEHPLIRVGLLHLVSETTDLELAPGVTSATEAIASLERRQPSLVLSEIHLPGRSGLDLAKEIHTRFREVPVLFHSSADEHLYTERAIQVGALGFVPKRSSTRTLLAAIRTAIAGGRVIPPQTAAPRNALQAASAMGTLTDREFEVFRLIGQGCNSRAIADHLHISLKTVDAHREHLKQKLALDSGTALNLLAIRWVTTDGQSPTD